MHYCAWLSLDFFVFYVYDVLPGCLYTTHIRGGFEGQERSLGHQKLELRVVVRYHVGYRKLDPYSLELLLNVEPSLQPNLFLVWI